MTPSISTLPHTAEARVAKPVCYPDSDGKRMSDNTVQFGYIVGTTTGFGSLYQDEPEVFIAGDLLWYPVEGDPKIRQAPDVLIAFGRPKGDRGSYKQWEEGGVPPQVVFEILSPSNSLTEMARKRRFYDQYGVEEYYEYEPDRGELCGYIRRDGRLEVIDDMEGWTSPRTGVSFWLDGGRLVLVRPDGRPFLTFKEILASQEIATAERQRAERLAQRLRELGVPPESL